MRIATYFRAGATVTQFENGALTESNPRLNYTSTYFGEATGDKALEYEVGPHVDAEIFSIYGNQDAASPRFDQRRHRLCVQSPWVGEGIPRPHQVRAGPWRS